MADLTVTTTVEDWARRRRIQALLTEVTRAAAVGIVLAGAIVSVVAWFPSLSFLLVPASMVLVGLAGWVWWRTRHALRPRAVAAVVDLEADTEGLVQTALAIEQGRAAVSPAVAAVVKAQAVERLPELDEIGGPPLTVPVGPAWVGGIGAVLCSLALAAALVVSTISAITAPPESGVPAFDRERVSELEAAAETLDALLDEPGLEPLSKRDLKIARDHVRTALGKRDDPAEAARALDRARQSLAALETRPLRSAAALQAARPEELAEGLDAALGRSDPGAARRLGEEVLRRVDGGTSDGELLQLGKALSEKVTSKTRAGSAAREAGRALESRERGAALSALADLMASLGEPARYEPRRDALAEAEEAVERARVDAVDAMEDGRETPRSEEGGRRGASSEPTMEEPTEDGDGDTPSPVEGRQGGEGDGGGGSAEGGTKDLKDGGTPGAGGEPEVRVDGERPAGGREEGPSASGGRTVAGEGPASEGTAPQDAPAGAGEGGLSEGGLPSEDAAGAPPSVVSGAGPAARAGVEGMGSSGVLDSPILELDPETVAEEWVDLQWDGAGEAMGDVLDVADAGGRSGVAWTEVHKRYDALAESATRRTRLPLTRRDYVRRYFEAIRPGSATADPDADGADTPADPSTPERP